MRALSTWRPDVKLQLGGELLPAHRILLEESSSVLRTYLISRQVSQTTVFPSAAAYSSCQGRDNMPCILCSTDPSEQLQEYSGDLTFLLQLQLCELLEGVPTH